MFGLIRSSIKLVLLFFIVNWLYKWLLSYGVGLKFNDVKPGPCRVVPGIKCGSEQISVTKNGLAFITNGLRLATNCNLKYLRGGIYLLDFNNPDKNVTKLEIIGDIDMNAFDPHGMDILEDEGNLINIYVVNHANYKESIEIFLYDFNEPNKLKHKKTLKHHLFTCLNSLTIIDEEKFYVTNSMKHCNTKLPGLSDIEMFLGFSTASIIYYDNGKASVVWDNEYLFNGITLSKDKSRVFAILSMSRLLYVFKRNQESGALTKTAQHDLKFVSDNVFLDKQSGNLYIGMMKSFSCVRLLFANLTDHCSGTGVKVSPHSSDWKSVNIEEIVHLNGKDFVSVSSSFVHYKGHYLIGTVFEKLGYCHDQC